MQFELLCAMLHLNSYFGANECHLKGEVHPVLLTYRYTVIPGVCGVYSRVSSLIKSGTDAEMYPRSMLPTQSISVTVRGASEPGKGRLEKRGDSRGSWRSGRVVELGRRYRRCRDAERTEAQQSGLPRVTAVERMRWMVVVMYCVGENRSSGIRCLLRVLS